jgi:hypothetical protein
MLKKLLFSLVICTPVFFCLQKTILAADTPPVVPIDQPSSAIKAIIEQGVVEYEKGVKKARFSLEWNPLPINEELVKSLGQHKKVDLFPQTEEINQNNSKNIACGLKSKDLLYEALGVKKNSNCDLLVPDKELQEIELKALFTTGGIKPSEYIAMSEERNILRTILKSKGVEYAFRIKDSGDIEVPDFKDKDIIWKVKIYKYIWPSASTNLYYYRFSVKAVVKPFDKNILSNQIELKKISFDATIRIKDLDRQISIPNEFFSMTNLGEIIPNLVNPPDTKKVADEAASNFSTLSGVFNIFGGGKQLGIATQGIFSGTENSSFISGGLLNFSNGGVDPLIGVSREIGKIGDISTGIVFGVGLGEKTSIFLGPSLQTSIFTLSAGATLGAREQSDLNFAGLISVDISRLTGSKTEVNTITVENPSVGGNSNIREKIDADTSLNTLVKYSVKSKSSQQTSFDLRLVCDKDRVKIEKPTKKQRIGKPEGIVYLEKGVYEYVIESGLSISVSSASSSVPVNADSIVDLTENTPQSFTWEVNKSVSNSQGMKEKKEVSTPNGQEIKPKEKCRSNPSSP